MGFEVLQGGMLTTVQDEGRFGYQQYGVTPSGPMDTRSFHLANVLVGNERTEAALEATFTGPTLRFTEANVIVVAGGDLGARLNGEPMPIYRAVAVQEGDVLSFAGMVSGCRSYIAFAGGLDVPEMMGSRSTILKIHKGGFQGRKLEQGDTVGFRAPAAELPDMDARMLPAEIFPAGETVLRVVLGPQDDAFPPEQIRKFFWYDGVISNEFDRMGCRIEREPIRHKVDGNIITDGISFGSIQIPTNGKPIIMLADRQSTGGYTKIGTVISVDLPKLAQSLPGQRVRFVQVSLELAQELYVREYDWITELENRWRYGVGISSGVGEL